MNFIGTCRLETPRLILRKFELNDSQEVFDNYASSDEVSEYVSWNTHKSVDETKTYIESLLKNYSDLKFFKWAIVLKDTGEVIGFIEGKEIDEIRRRVEVGYCIGKNWWGKGIVTEALKEVIKFFFYKVDMNRIEAFYDVRNIASGRVMQKCGMRFEGVVRERSLFKYGVYDSYIYAILKKDLALMKDF